MKSRGYSYSNEEQPTKNAKQANHGLKNKMAAAGERSLQMDA